MVKVSISSKLLEQVLFQGYQIPDNILQEHGLNRSDKPYRVHAHYVDRRRTGGFVVDFYFDEESKTPYKESDRVYEIRDNKEFDWKGAFLDLIAEVPTEILSKKFSPQDRVFFYEEINKKT